MRKFKRGQRIYQLKRDDNLVTLKPTLFLSKDQAEKLKELRETKHKYWIDTKSLAEYIEGLIIEKIEELERKREKKVNK
jgi:hypothetical protein